ncbi:MAG TPA: hypothetical protein VNB06_13485, partial [Thermoanaerobaculia bacterium]|nr:hypothetical protein [Thermoanaerobaculia bacterium]
MSRPTRFSCVFACIAVSFAAAAGAQSAGVAASPAVAETSSYRLDFAPQVDHDGATLTVSGPEHFYLRQMFAVSDPMFIGSEVDGTSLADGQYAWEISFSPRLSASTRAALARARDTGDESALSELRASGALPSAPMVASGSFRIEQGAFVASDEPEPRPSDRSGVVRQQQPGIVRVASADQVIPDDLIVQGSLCVGVDCVNNENFGFDTIRMKENNTRLQFTDTSTATGFPNNNWQIRANASSSGGANFLAFVDQGATGSSESGTLSFLVGAGAPANSINVHSSGRVGFRTANPVLDLHVATGNTPGLRLEQNGSAGFTPRTWDIAGNEANFFVRDVTGGSRL